MDIRKVKKLIELLEESGISEIEIKEGEEAVRISRGPIAGAMPQYIAAPYAAPPPPPAAAAPAAAATAPGTPQIRRRDDKNIVPSPMVGTFYAAASPTNPPFVQVGDDVKGGSGPVHHRGHEDDEPDRERPRRQGHRDHGQERRPGGIRAAAVRGRMTLIE